MPGWPASSEAIRMLLVTTVSPCQAPRSLRCRATKRAELLASRTMLSPSATPGRRDGAHPGLLLALEALADLERESGAGSPAA